MQTDKTARERFDSLAKDYDRGLFAGTERTSVRRFAALWSLAGSIAPSGPGRILEIGSGTGMYTRLLSASYPEAFWVGTDVSGAMLAQAGARLKGSRVRLVQAGAEALPFLSAGLDLVFSFACLHHIKNSEAVFVEVHRVLKPGGHFFMMEPNPLNPVNIFLGLARPHERGMLVSSPGRWIPSAGRAGLALVGLKSGAFFPSWPRCCWGIYDTVEPALEKFWLTRRFALFYFYAFKKL